MVLVIGDNFSSFVGLKLNIDTCRGRTASKNKSFKGSLVSGLQLETTLLFVDHDKTTALRKETKELQSVPVEFWRSMLDLMTQSWELRHCQTPRSSWAHWTRSRAATKSQVNPASSLKLADVKIQNETMFKCWEIYLPFLKKLITIFHNLQERHNFDWNENIEFWFVFRPRGASGRPNGVMYVSSFVLVEDSHPSSHKWSMLGVNEWWRDL